MNDADNPFAAVLGDGFAYQSGELHAEDVALSGVARGAGTPAYVYSANAIRRRYADLKNAFAGQGLDPLLCYALKALSNVAVVRLLAREGSGADTVSGGEVKRALAAGVEPAKIVYAGVAKTDDEIRFALRTGILQFNVESAHELGRVSEVASAEGLEARVAIRVNPDVDAGTLAKISTGRRGDKFGIDLGDAAGVYRHAAGLPGVKPFGLHLHIGSQIHEIGSFLDAYERGAELYAALNREGLGLEVLDLGGGMGVRYRGETPFDLDALAAGVARVTDGLGAKLVFEPGRFLVAEAGVLLSRVIHPKNAGGKRFLILDAGMHTLVRPAMYDAWHDAVPVNLQDLQDGAQGVAPPADLVGPICESTDVLGRNRGLPLMQAGDLVALTAAGAYGAVMASNYNSRGGVAEALVDGSRWALIRPPEPVEDQIDQERIPAWLSEPHKIAAD